MLRLCEHFKKSPEGYTEYVEFSDGYIVNGWRNVYDREGKLVITCFEEGIYIKYLKHLLENEGCRKAVEISKEWVEEELEILT